MSFLGTPCILNHFESIFSTWSSVVFFSCSFPQNTKKKKKSFLISIRGWDWVIWGQKSHKTVIGLYIVINQITHLPWGVIWALLKTPEGFWSIAFQICLRIPTPSPKGCVVLNPEYNIRCRYCWWIFPQAAEMYSKTGYFTIWKRKRTEKNKART